MEKEPLSLPNSILSRAIRLDRTAAYDLAILLSELHGRYCERIASCGDMEEATRLAQELGPICEAHVIALELFKTKGS